MSENSKIQKIINNLIQKAKDIEVQSNVDFSGEQVEMLVNLNEYCVEQILSDPEVIRDPRKIFYKANIEFKMALVAICLSQAIANTQRKGRENKEYFEENITVSAKEPNIKFVSFGMCIHENIADAIYWDIIEDWKIYRDKEGFGIYSLLDDKTNLTGLKDFKPGGDFIYEFARFQRKYTEKEKIKEERARESAQEAFRNAIVQTMAVETAKQYLLEGKNPMDLVNALMAPDRKQKRKEKINPEIEQNIFKLLEDKTDK